MKSSLAGRNLREPRYLTPLPGAQREGEGAGGEGSPENTKIGLHLISRNFM